VVDALVSGLLAGYGVAMPMGPIGILLMSLAARTSLLVGAAAGLGAATADLLYATLAVGTGAALDRLIRPAATPLRWVAAAVLVGLAVRMAVSAWRHHRDPNRAATSRTALRTPVRSYLGVLGLTLLNPTTVIYFAALVLGRQSGAALGGAGLTAFVLAAFLASASWQLLLVGGGSVLGRVLSGTRGRLVLAWVSAAVIAGLAVRLLV
jgi:arginine exporter protein ArgO